MNTTSVIGARELDRRSNNGIEDVVRWNSRTDRVSSPLPTRAGSTSVDEQRDVALLNRARVTRPGRASPKAGRATRAPCLPLSGTGSAGSSGRCNTSGRSRVPPTASSSPRRSRRGRRSQGSPPAAAAPPKAAGRTGRSARLPPPTPPGRVDPQPSVLVGAPGPVLDVLARQEDRRGRRLADGEKGLWRRHGRSARDPPRSSTGAVRRRPSAGTFRGFDSSGGP